MVREKKLDMETRDWMQVFSPGRETEILLTLFISFYASMLLKYNIQLSINILAWFGVQLAVLRKT